MTDRPTRTTDWLEPQSNVLPLDAARNEGKFWGAILLGREPLNLLQRVGIVILATPLLASGVGLFFFLLNRPGKFRFDDPIYPFGIISLKVAVATIGGLSLALGTRMALIAGKTWRSK